MIRICPNCNQRYSVKEYDVDFIHKCIGPQAIVTESIPIVGDYEDDEGNIVAVPNAMLLGAEDKSVRPDVNINEINVHGENKNTHRLKKYNQYIKLR